MIELFRRKVGKKVIMHQFMGRISGNPFRGGRGVGEYSIPVQKKYHIEGAFRKASVPLFTEANSVILQHCVRFISYYNYYPSFR